MAAGNGFICNFDTFWTRKDKKGQGRSVRISTQIRGVPGRLSQTLSPTCFQPTDFTIPKDSLMCNEDGNWQFIFSPPADLQSLSLWIFLNLEVQCLSPFTPPHNYLEVIHYLHPSNPCTHPHSRYQECLLGKEKSTPLVLLTLLTWGLSPVIYNLY